MPGSGSAATPLGVAGVSPDYAAVLVRLPAGTLVEKMVRALMTAAGPREPRPADDVKREVYGKSEASRVSLEAVRRVRSDANKTLATLTHGRLRIMTSGRGRVVEIVTPPAAVPDPAAAPVPANSPA